MRRRRDTDRLGVPLQKLGINLLVKAARKIDRLGLRLERNGKGECVGALAAAAGETARVSNSLSSDLDMKI